MTQKDQGVAISLLWPVVCFEDLSGARAGCPWLWDAGRAGWDWGELTLRYHPNQCDSMVQLFPCAQLALPRGTEPEREPGGNGPAAASGSCKGEKSFLPSGV